jgi:TolA-binding protein
MSLDEEDVSKLRVIAIAIIRHETPSFDDLEWLVEQTYALDLEAAEHEPAMTNADERADAAESQLEDAQARIEELEVENNRLQAAEIIRQGTADFNPDRLHFLRNSLASCLQSVDLALADKPATKPAPRKGRPRE